MNASTGISQVHVANAAEECAPPKVLILYDDVAAGRRAIRALSNVFKSDDEGHEYKPQLWRLDLLEDPDRFGSAVADAINADIVVISASASGSINTTVARWMSFCLERKRGTTGAVVAMLGAGRTHAEPNRLQLQLLEAAVLDSGLDFFMPASKCRSRRKPVFASRSCRPQSVSGSHEFITTL